MKMRKRKIKLTKSGDIDWNANGWPDPNPEGLSMVNGLSTAGMPDDIFDQWQNECDNLDVGWEVDW